MKPSKPSSKNRKAKVVRKGGRKTKGSVAAQKSAVSDDEEMDIKKPLFPLAHYVNDRVQLTDEIFRTMNKHGRLNAMLPAILKEVSIVELKRLCVEQLEVMSKKRIRSILAGVEMETSSGTEDSGNESENVGDVTTSNPQAADSTGLEVSEGGGLEQTESLDVIPSDQNDVERSSEVRIESDMLELHPENEGDDDDDDILDDVAGDGPAQSNAVSNDSGAAMEGLADGSSTIARTYLEILELEMRARAIKSLLKSHPIPTDIE